MIRNRRFFVKGFYVRSVPGWALNSTSRIASRPTISIAMLIIKTPNATALSVRTIKMVAAPNAAHAKAAAWYGVVDDEFRSAQICVMPVGSFAKVLYNI